MIFTNIKYNTQIITLTILTFLFFKYIFVHLFYHNRIFLQNFFIIYILNIIIISLLYRDIIIEYFFTFFYHYYIVVKLLQYR